MSHYSSSIDKSRYRIVAKKRRGPKGLASAEDAHCYADHQVDTGAWPPIVRLESDARYWVFLADVEKP